MEKLSRWNGEENMFSYLSACESSFIFMEKMKKKKNVRALGDGLFVEFVCGHATEDYKWPRVLLAADLESSTCGSASWLNIIFKRMPLTFSSTSIFCEISSAIVSVAVFSREKIVLTTVWHNHRCFKGSSTLWSQWIILIFLLEHYLLVKYHPLLAYAY